MVSKNTGKNTIISKLLMIFVISLLGGCVASTQVYVNDNVEIRQYGKLYLIPPKEDPRNIVTKVVEKFKQMGFNVTLVNPEKPLEGAQGSGFLISQNGHVVTCAHVIGEEREATIWLGDKKYEADVVSIDKKTDLAILRTKCPVSVGKPISFRSDTKFSLGEEVFTIGYPMSNLLGNSARFSKGLVSSTSGLKDDPNHVQISAEIQPGSSGGPLFDKNGTVVGVVQETLNPWKMARRTGGALPQNINFAIKSFVTLEFIKTNDSNLYSTLSFDQKSSFEEVESAVVKVKSGILPEELEDKPKLVVMLDYESLWDVWYRFRYFALSFYDFDSQELLFRAGQVGDNLVSNEEVVIEDTFADIRKILKK